MNFLNFFGGKRDREVTYTSSSGDDNGDNDCKKNDDSTEFTPSSSQSLPEHGGKLLIKNCYIWQWNEDGCSNVELEDEDGEENIERIISGELVPLRYLSVDHYGRISKLLTVSQEVIDESLYETVIEARDRVILPGLMDAHIHVMHTGESAYYVDLSDCNSIAELQEAVRSHYLKNHRLPWIMGINWDQTNLSRLPTRYDLDEVVPDTPVFLWRACWHIGVANTAALRKGGIDLSRTSFDIPGGEVQVTPSGPTGILKENAVKLVLAAQSDKTETEKERFISEGLELCLKSGLTAVQTNDDHCLDIYRDMAKAPGGLPIRVFLTPVHEELLTETPVKASGPIPTARFLKPKSAVLVSSDTDVTTQGSFLLMDRLKIFTDGSLGADTAAIKDLSDDGPPVLAMAVEEEQQEKEKDYRGILLHSSPSLTEMVRVAKESGFRLEIHCIGDKAAEQTLSALEEAGCGPADRPVMTHCQVLSPAIIRRMKAVGAIANVQPSFVPTDMRWVQERLAPSQIENSYCWKTLLQRGVWVAGGSDSPIESFSPFRGMYDAIFRTAHDANPDDLQDVFRPAERLTFDEALWLYTIGAAYAAHCEEVLGKVEVGYAADLVLVDPSPLDDCRGLKDLEPDLVIVGGDVKFTHPTAGLKGITVVSSSSSGSDSAMGTAKRVRREESPGTGTVFPQRGPYVPGKNGPVLSLSARDNSNGKGMSKGLPRISGFCACWLKGKFCEQALYCQPTVLAPSTSTTENE